MNPNATEGAKTPALFRFRVLIFTALYLVGFYAPGARYLSSTHSLSTTWITLASLAARTGLVNLYSATLLVTILAIACAVAGAWLRVWATAYLGAGVMNDKSLRADHVMASGPYRFLRNPLYLGNLLTCAAISILMPVAGAVFFLVGCTLLTFALVAAEGPHLAQQLGSAYDTYRAQIPSFIPVLRSQVAASTAKPHWAQSFAAEVFHVGIAVCLLLFAWQYNVDILIRCVLVCFGLGLVANGIFSARALRPVEMPPVS